MIKLLHKNRIAGTCASGQNLKTTYFNTWRTQRRETLAYDRVPHRVLAQDDLIG